MTRLAKSILVLGLSVSCSTPALTETVLDEKQAMAICQSPEVNPHRPQLIIIVNGNGKEVIVPCGKYTKRPATVLGRGTLFVTQGSTCTLYISTNGDMLYLPPNCAN